MRLKLYICAAALLALGFAQPAQATIPDMPPDLIAQCEREAPLAQRDVDAFVNMWPLILASNGELPAQEAAELYKKNGLSEARGTLVIMKIANARTITTIVNTTKDKDMAVRMLRGMNMPQVFIPSDAEIELVRKNKAVIDALPGMTAQ